MLGADSAALRSAWKRDLDSALARVKLPALRDEDVRLAWYADALDPSSDAYCDRSSRGEADLGSFARGFLVTMAAMVAEAEEDNRQARSLFADLLYLADPDTRCAAEERIASAMAEAQAKGRPVIIVAYSLGSAVAYEHLRRRVARDTPPLHFITLGSPLGVWIAREVLFGGRPLEAPPGVTRWVNIYDPEDGLAAPLGIAGGLVHDRAVRLKTSGSPHEAGRYLRDEATGEALGDALTEVLSSTTDPHAQARQAARVQGMR